MRTRESRVRESLAKRFWTAQRFGLSPGKVRARLGNRLEARVLCISLPKAGTHLIERALCLHPRLYRRLIHTVHESNIEDLGLEQLLGKLGPGQIILSHLFHSKERQRLIEKSGVRCVFLIRDPRDIIVSEASYLMTHVRHAYHDALRDVEDRKAAILRCIEGVPSAGLPAIGVVLSGMEGWLDSGCHVVRFEHLIGSAGGGAPRSQLAALGALYEFIGIDVAESWLASLSQRLFTSASPTFRRGAIGEWREHFDPEVTAAFERVAGGAVVRYGYDPGGMPT